MTKTPTDAKSVMTELVLPNMTNPLNNLMGGYLLYMMDVCAAITSQRHANRVCVTASVDSVDFKHPIKLGDIVILEGKVNRAFNSSMEVEITVWAENPRTQRKTQANTAYYTMVALDEELNPVKIPAITPETEEEKAKYQSAERRRQLRLVLAGRMKLGDAENLRNHLNQ
jgi:acyl-CoA hydrolase